MANEGANLIQGYTGVRQMQLQSKALKEQIKQQSNINDFNMAKLNQQAKTAEAVNQLKQATLDYTMRSGEQAAKSEDWKTKMELGIKQLGVEVGQGNLRAREQANVIAQEKGVRTSQQTAATGLAKAAQTFSGQMLSLFKEGDTFERTKPMLDILASEYLQSQANILNAAGGDPEAIQQGLEQMKGVLEEQIGQFAPPDAPPGWIDTMVDKAASIMGFGDEGQGASIDQPQGAQVTDVEMQEYNAYLDATPKEWTDEQLSGLTEEKLQRMVDLGLITKAMVKTTMDMAKKEMKKRLL